MTKIELLAFAAILLFTAVMAKPLNINDIIQKVPEEERFEFVKRHLKLGYELEKSSEENKNASPPILKSNNEIPEEFSVLLYNYVRQQALVTNEEVLRQLREIICFEDGSCVDIGDIGVHP